MAAATFYQRLVSPIRVKLMKRTGFSGGGVCTSSLVRFHTCCLLVHRRPTHSSCLVVGKQGDEAREMLCRDCWRSGTVVQCSRRSCNSDRCRNERSDLDKRVPIEAYYEQELMPACSLKSLRGKVNEWTELVRVKEL